MEKGKKKIRILVEKTMKNTLTGKKSQPSFSKKTMFEGASKWTRNSPKRNNKELSHRKQILENMIHQKKIQINK